ncbi:MAG: hypothetical protein IJ555_06850 [Ruminococcus sp.]|nr:hypothetical protein [Ruminococcus sp.]
MKHTWKKAAAGLLAMALVVGAAPANVGTGGFLGGTAITANAEGTMVGQHFKLPAQRASTTISFPGASESNPIYIKDVNTITSENVELSYSAAGSYWEVYLNGTQIYRATPAAPYGIYIASGSGTASDPYVWDWNYNRGNGAKLSDFHVGDVFNGIEVTFTESTFTLPATTGKWITVTTGETSTNYSLENGATLTGLDASSTFEIYTPDISTATINLEYNTANITSVRHEGKNLTETTEYTVAYTDENNEPIEKPNPTDYGSYHVTVTGAGKYSGSVTKDFSIVKIQLYNVTLSDNNGHSKAYNNTELPLTIERSVFQYDVLMYDWGYRNYSFMIWNDVVINADTQSFDVQYRDYSSGGSGQMTINVNVEKLQSTVTTAPTALENLTANGSEMELLDTSNAAADNGTLYYALSENADTAPTSGWSAAAPTGKEAGTYYVWYKAVGDNGYADTEPVCLTVEIGAADTTLVTGKTYKQTAEKDGKYYTRFVFVKPLSEIEGKSKATFTAHYNGTDYSFETTSYYTGMTSNGISYTPESEESVLFVVTITSGSDISADLTCDIAFE